MIAWNNAATPVAADMNDPALSVEHFGERTKSDRAKMRTSLAAMDAAIATAIDPALGDVLHEIVGSYTDKMTGIDDLAVAAKTSDYAAFEAALRQWQNGIDRQREALPQLLEAVRPYLSPEELSDWEQLLP